MNQYPMFYRTACGALRLVNSEAELKGAIRADRIAICIAVVVNVALGIALCVFLP